jgi:hypothetical protein
LPTSRRTLTAPSSTSARDPAPRRRCPRAMRRLGEKIPHADDHTRTRIARVPGGGRRGVDDLAPAEPLTCVVAEPPAFAGAARPPPPPSRRARPGARGGPLPPARALNVLESFRCHGLGDGGAGDRAVRLPIEAAGVVAAGCRGAAP